MTFSDPKFSNKFNSYPLATRLAIIATLSGLLYLFIFILPFPLSRFYNTNPPVDYTKLTGYSQSGFWAYFLGVITLFMLYIWAIRLCTPPARLSFKVILGSSITFAFSLIFSYPLTAIDLFIYAIRTRGWALYGLPPLSTPPESLPISDPWLGLAGEWVNASSPYGPLWELLSLLGFYVSGGTFLSHLFALKIMALLAYLGCIGFVYQILVTIRPKWAIAGTVAFAWNPLVLFESIQNGHNDIVMLFFMMAAIWVLVQWSQESASLKSGLLALLVCFFLALSILVKFVTILVVPFFLGVLVIKQSTWLRRAGTLLMYSLITMVLVVWPMMFVWPGWENWAVLKAGSGAGRSLLALLVLSLRASMGTNPAFDISRNLILISYALIYLYFLGKTLFHFYKMSANFQARSYEFFVLSLSAAFYTLFWYVLLAAPVFHAWYLLWFLPLAPLLLPQQRPLSAAIFFSMTALLVIPYFETIRVWYPFLLQNHLLGHLIGVPLLIVPPILALIWPISLTAISEV